MIINQQGKVNTKMNLNEFRSAMRYGGARASRFRVRIANPVDPAIDLDLPLYCKSASLPGITQNQLELFYGGMSIKVEGQKTYDNWSATFYNDQDFKIKNAFDTWMNIIRGPETNVNKFASTDISNYKSVVQIEQLSTKDEVLRTIELSGAFPVSVSSIELAWENEAIQEFTVDFAYDYWTVVDGITGDGGGI